MLKGAGSDEVYCEQSSLDTLQSADQKFNSCRVQSEKAEARFQEVKTRLMWDMHLPLEHLLTIFKFAGEGGRYHPPNLL